MREAVLAERLLAAVAAAGADFARGEARAIDGRTQVRWAARVGGHELEGEVGDAAAGVALVARARVAAAPVVLFVDFGRGRPDAAPADLAVRLFDDRLRAALAAARASAELRVVVDGGRVEVESVPHPDDAAGAAAAALALVATLVDRLAAVAAEAAAVERDGDVEARRETERAALRRHRARHDRTQVVTGVLIAVLGLFTVGCIIYSCAT